MPYENITFSTEIANPNSFGATLSITNNGTDEVSVFRGGSGAWNAAFYTTTTYTQPVTLEYFMNQYGGFMISFNDIVVSDNGNYTNLDYAAEPRSVETFNIFDNNTFITNAGSWDVTKTNRIVYADDTIKHYNGDTLMYTSPSDQTGSRVIDSSTSGITNGATMSKIRLKRLAWSPTLGYYSP